MFDFKKLFSIIFALCCVPVINAVIPEIEVWSDGTHYRYLLKDWHRDYGDGRNTIQQHNDIMWAAKQKLPNVFMIAEDALIYEGDDKLTKALFDHMPRTIELCISNEQEFQASNVAQVQHKGDVANLEVSPLDCLVIGCRDMGIPSYNVDCKQTIYLYKHHPEDITPELEIVCQQTILADLSEHVNALAKNKNTGGYQEFLKQKLESLKQMAYQGNRERFIAQALEIRRFLVDVRTLVQLDEWRDITHGFICEGAGHIENIKGNLPAIGYQHVQTIGMIKELNDDQIELGILDLRVVFEQIFAEQNRVIKPASFWFRHKAYLATGISTAIIFGGIVWQYFYK